MRSSVSKIIRLIANSPPHDGHFTHDSKKHSALVNLYPNFSVMAQFQQIPFLDCRPDRPFVSQDLGWPSQLPRKLLIRFAAGASQTPYDAPLMGRRFKLSRY